MLLRAFQLTPLLFDPCAELHISAYTWKLYCGWIADAWRPSIPTFGAV